MDSSLKEKISEELEMLEAIFSEDNVVVESAKESQKFARCVECTFNL